MKLSYDYSFVVDRIGRSGGVAVIWHRPFSCQILNYSSNYINMEVLEVDRNVRWRLTGFYGYPERVRRRDSWELIRNLASMSSLPWCIIGDFNDMLKISDKKGRVEHLNWLFNGFREVVHERSLFDLPLVGYHYTWSGRRSQGDIVEERIDRTLVSGE